MAPLAYATLGGVKRRLQITDSNDDDRLNDIIADVNQDVEDMTGRPVGPGTVSNELIDGYDAIESGRCILYPKGIRSVTTLEVAATTGDTFVTVPAGDIYLRPEQYRRQPDWPAFEIWMTDIPASTNTLPVFLPGYANIRLTATIGWASIPSTVISAAETTAVRTFLSNLAGHPEGSEDVGVRNFRALWRAQDLRTLARYEWKEPEII